MLLLIITICTLFSCTYKNNNKRYLTKRYICLNKKVNCEESSTIAYETNVTDISNYYGFSAGNYEIIFIDKNKDGVEKEISGSCNILKYDISLLYLLV